MKAPDFILGKIVVTDYGKQRPCRRSEAVAYNLAPADDDLQSAGLSQDELGKPTYPF